MAINRIAIAAAPQQVFAALADARSYPEWVIGAAEVVDVDETWPARGGCFTYRIGRPPVTWEGSTCVDDVDPPRLLTLRTQLPLGTIEICFELRPADRGTEVVVTESAAEAHLRPPYDVALHLRNSQTLARLKAHVERRPQRLFHPEGFAALAPGGHWLHDPAYADALASAQHAYLAVTSADGPHVTPAAFALFSGRIWMVIPRSSVKARGIARDSRVGVMIRGRDRSLSLVGVAAVLDVRRLWIPEHLTERALAPLAALRYLGRNVPRMPGYLPAALTSIADLNPAARVLISVAPQRLAATDGAGVVERRGPRTARSGPPATDVRRASGRPLDLEEVPESLSGLAEGTRTRAVLAWEGQEGAIALPAHWHPERNLASVPAALLEGATSGRVALCLDEHADGGGPKGLLIRGEGRIVGENNGFAAVSIEQDKATVWKDGDGFTVES